MLLELCLWIVGKLTGQPRDNSTYPGWREREMSRGLLGVALFFFLMLGVPVLAVAWGFATGRLPAPSPYLD